MEERNRWPFRYIVVGSKASLLHTDAPGLVLRRLAGSG
jgi:hypothetical protein